MSGDTDTRHVAEAGVTQAMPRARAAGAVAGAPRPHSVVEDLLALLIGSLLIGLGLLLRQAAQLFTGGIAGIALILHYLTGQAVVPLFVAANLPFMLFAWYRMGAAFTLKTLAVNLLLALISLGLPHVIRVQVEPLFAAVAGGVLVGLGLLTLVRHRASVGGIGIVAIWAQNRHGISAGRVQMAADAVILLTALLVLPTGRLPLSVASAFLLDLILLLNHRPGRYVGF